MSRAFAARTILADDRAGLAIGHRSEPLVERKAALAICNASRQCASRPLPIIFGFAAAGLPANRTGASAPDRRILPAGFIQHLCRADQRFEGGFVHNIAFAEVDRPSRAAVEA